MTDDNDNTLRLSPEDGRLLDALVDNGFDLEALEALSADERRRAETLVGLFELLEDYPVEDADDSLVHATLARIDRHEEEAAARLAFDGQQAGEAGGSMRRFRIPDVISLAAMFLIGASVAIPLLSNLRQRSIEGACSENLRHISVAFSSYASDYDGAMPTAMAGFGPDLSWDKVRNVVNLEPLISDGYCERGHLDCPGNHDLDPSYSYQWQQGDRRPVWGVTRIEVVLADRNPIIDAARSGRYVGALTTSLNHGGRGQNALSSDGRAVWLDRPVVGGNDNIWLPRGVTFLRAGDRPSEPDDVFLAH